MERAFAVVKQWWRFEASYSVAPAQSVPIVRMGEEGGKGVMMALGTNPFFAKGVPPKYSTINARIETVETAASYRGPWKRGPRCIEVAAGSTNGTCVSTVRSVPISFRSQIRKFSTLLACGIGHSPRTARQLRAVCISRCRRTRS